MTPQELAQKFNAISPRERGILVGSFAFAVLFIGYSYGISPQLVAKERAFGEIEKHRSALGSAQTSITATGKVEDPDAANHKAMEAAKREVAELDDKFQKLSATMVPPEKMQAFLEAILAQNKKLELISLTTLSPTEFVTTKPSPSSEEQPFKKETTKKVAATLYKHGMEIKIVGSYADLTAYLSMLEEMPQRIIWDKVVLTVGKYPKNELSMTVYTISLDKQWLTV